MDSVLCTRKLKGGDSIRVSYMHARSIKSFMNIHNLSLSKRKMFETKAYGLCLQINLRASKGAVTLCNLSRNLSRNFVATQVTRKIAS
jgi:hypothetical protein